jgi:hypothetical protein
MGRFDEWLNDTKPVTVTPVSSAVIQPEETTEVTPPAITDMDELVEVDIAAPQQPEETLFDEIGSTESAPVAALPGELATRDQDISLKPRFKGHSPLNSMVRLDWMKLIELHPDNFDALLFRPDPEDVGEVDEESGIEGPSYTELNNNQRDLRYLDPVPVKVLDCPDERDSFQVVDSDGEQDGLSDELQLLRIAAENVSIGSILTWNEEMASGKLAQRWWYVHRIYSFGTQHVGSLYYCIPARNMDTTEGGIVK